jgi:phosphopantothenoylcysteine decarboxylase/phosphopantothenate--cysteine ligase
VSSSRRILITAGPTREPIDAVRYLSNRSTGRMGVAIISAALRLQHEVTAILGPISLPVPPAAKRIDVETAAEMQRAVEDEFPNHDLLIMAAAVADYRPKRTHHGKLDRDAGMTLEFEPTDDIIAAASRAKRADQRTVAFSLELHGNLDRARDKMHRKHVDLMIYNPTDSMGSETVESVLLYPDGRSENLACRGKDDFADILMERVAGLF